MKELILIISALFLLTIGWSQSQITAIEYYIDSDPGVGNGTEVIITPGEDITESLSVDISGLDEGIHTINFRAKDENDNWGLYTNEVFWVRDPVDQTITNIEYFIGADPGVGNATQMDVDDDMEIDEVFSSDVNGLDPQTHSIKVRAQNADGLWGLYSKEIFMANNLTSPNEVLAVEYFIDEDPGVGNGTPVSFTPGIELDETLQIEIPEDIPEGDHWMYIRVKHSGDYWSLYAKHEFVVDNTVSIDEALSLVSIYPNPVVDQLYIQSGEVNIQEARIYDGTGKLVVKDNSRVNSVDLSGLARGSYLVHVVTDVGTKSIKVAKQ